MLYFASQNPHKLREIQAMTGLDIRPLSELGFTVELDESGSTLQENALQKARFVWQNFQVDCFAEDTGLEVEVLNGEPGVRSARYAGEGKSAEDNLRKVLAKVKGMNNRKARFRTVVALILKGHEHLFEGLLEGSIATKSRGTEGFGYDPVFVPAGSSLTLAQMSLSEKNQISHRAKAVRKMVDFLGNKGL